MLLGSTRVGGISVDRDIVAVERHEGRFSAISIEATESPIFMLGVTVVFGNDEVQQIDLRQRLNPERTQPIDLQGRARPIKRFEIAARADFHRRGILNIYAEQVHEREVSASTTTSLASDDAKAASRRSRSKSPATMSRS